MAIDLDLHRNSASISGRGDKHVTNPLTRRALGTSGLFVHKLSLQSGSESTRKSTRKPSNFNSKNQPPTITSKASVVFYFFPMRESPHVEKK
jgi:hypothetical protein